MSTTTALLVALALLAANVFFVGAEFALISARRSQIEPYAEAGSRRARITLRALERVALLMTSAQLGVTAASLGLGAVAEPAVAQLLDAPLAALLSALHLPAGLRRPVALAVALVIVVSVHMVLGEMVPKNLAIAAPRQAALWLGPPLAGITAVLRPVIRGLNAVANGVVRLFGVRPQPAVSSAYSAEEVGGLIAESRREGVLGVAEHQLLTGALAFDRQTVAAVLLPVDQLVTLPVTATPVEVQRLCVRTGYSRFPVAVAGKLIGYIHVKDFLTEDPVAGARQSVGERLRPLPTVRATDSLRAALTGMRSRGAHLAKVVAGDGELLGVVALEDVVEELVGEIRDVTRRA